MKPGSFDAQFHVTEPGALKRLGRDLRLLKFLAGMLWMNLRIGSKVRRKYRDCAASGEPFYVDDGMPR